VLESWLLLPLQLCDNPSDVDLDKK